MAMAPLIKEISEQTGLPWFNNPGPFKSTKGLLSGVRDGYLVSIGVVGQGMKECICAVIRFRRTADEKALLASMDRFKSFTGGGNFQLQGQTLVCTLPKPIQGTNGQKITEKLDQILRELALRAQPFDPGKCEGEGCRNEVSEITLINGNANFICGGCKIRIAGKQEEKRRRYLTTPSNYLKGFLFGTGGALAAGAASAVLSYWMTDDKGMMSVKLACILPFGIAMAAAFMVKMGIGKISRVSTLTAIIATFLGILLSNVLYNGLVIAHLKHLHLSSQLIGWVLNHLWELKWYEFGKLILFVEILSIFGSAHMLWEMRPKFPAAFISIGAPVTTHSGMVSSAKVGF